MKQTKLWRLAPFIATFCLCVSSTRAASTSGCDNSPRRVGVLGAEGNNQPAISIPANIRAELPRFKEALLLLPSGLAGPDEQMIVYNSSKDELDPRPKIAFLVNGKLAKLFDTSEFAPSGGGFDRYLASCRLQVAKGQPAVAIAISTAGDGTGSAFAIILWQSSGYRVIFKRQVSQGRIEFEDSALELWNRSFSVIQSEKSEMVECEWCPHRYNITQYVWRGDQYVKTGSQRTKRKFDPAEITGKPLIIQKH